MIHHLAANVLSWVALHYSALPLLPKLLTLFGVVASLCQSAAGWWSRVELKNERSVGR